MASEIVEAVARAIAQEQLKTTDMGQVARAALTVALDMMREPSEGMIEAAMETPGMKAADAAVVMAFIHGHRLPENQPSPLLQAWQAMHDQLRKEILDD